jgi:uncharacterized protein YwqG
MRNIATLADALATPAVHLVAVDQPSKSYLGGSPRLPAGMAWPVWQGRPLGFLVRLSLSEVHRAHRIDWLPAEGALLFFYDVEEQPWGFDPKDRGSCVVLHTADLDEPVGPTQEDEADAYCPRRNLEPRRIAVFPSSERPEVAALSLSDEESEAYWEWMDSPFDGLPRHQVGGLPAPVQGDGMELECQLASHGLYCGDSSGYQDPKATALASGAQDWRLLLQLDTDDDAGIMWGDCGMLYFWVRAEEAASGDFRNPWLILQCS